MSILGTVLTVILAWILIALGSWLWVIVSAKSSGTLLKPEAFAEKLANENAQIIDVREPAAYKRSHIMGARNIPAINFSQGKSGLRHDRDIFLYDDRLREVTRVSKILKKQGYQKDRIFILRGGYAKYTGKKTN